MRLNEIFPFFGAFSALDSRSIPKNAAGDHLNAREEDGAIRFRYGYRNLSSPPAGYSATLGLGYLQGYSGTTEKEEYVAAVTVSGNTRFYSINVSTGAFTEIKNGVSSVNLNASEWVFAAFDDDGFFINPNNTVPIYRHALEDATSLTAVAIPDAPTIAPTYVIKYGGGEFPYTQISFAGINVATEIAYTGSATATNASLESDNSLIIGHLASSKLESSFEVDLSLATAGVLDFTYNDFFAFVLTAVNNSFDIDPGSIRVQFSNNDGSPLTLIPSSVGVHNNAVRPAGTTGNSYVVEFGYIDKIRANFDNIKKFKVSYRVRSASSTATKNGLAVSKPYIGGVAMQLGESVDGPDGRYIGYSYYYSSPDWESGVSPLLFIPGAVLGGYSPAPGIGGLGVQVEITMTVSGDANVDKFRIYEQDRANPPVFHRIGEQADSDTTFDFRIAYVEALRLTEYAPAPFTFTGVTNMFSYKGHAIWFYNTGTSNVRYARNGDPLRQASDEDAQDDTSAGETFTLADNASDTPLGGIQAGDGVMIAGKYGVYSQIGDRAVEMTPPRKVSGSQGVAGKYGFCRWKDDSGIPGMAYMTQDGQVLFSIPGAFSDKEVGGTANLTELVRDGELSPKDFLLDEQASALSLTDFSTCQVFVDEQQDALWVVMGLRAMVLRRANLLSGARYWEHYEYTTGSSTTTIRYCSGSGKRRLRWIRSNGKFDEVEYNSTSRAYISGSNSDGGSAAPAGYWESKTFGVPVQICYVDVERDDYTDTPTVTVYSSDTPSGTAVAIASGDKGTKFDLTDGGDWYRVRTTISETTDPIRKIIAYETLKGRRIRG